MIPVSKKRSQLWNFRSVFIEKLNYIIKFELKVLILVSITVIPSDLSVSLPVSNKGLIFWKSWSQSRKREWHIESLDPSLEKGFRFFKVLIPVSNKGTMILKVLILSPFPKPSHKLLQVFKCEKYKNNLQKQSWNPFFSPPKTPTN